MDIGIVNIERLVKKQINVVIQCLIFYLFIGVAIKPYFTIK